jgi:hypothetical protein
MRILLSSENFDGFGGTESYTLTVAHELDALGHDVAIYSPNRGAVARFASSRGIRVIGAEQLPRTCDLVVFGDAPTCDELASRYRDAVRLFVMHSRDLGLQTPPKLEGYCDTVIVLNDRTRNALEASSWHPPVVRLRQPIDTRRFVHVGPPRARAKRALVLSNRTTGPRVALIEQACLANGIELVQVGVTTSPSATPEHAIAEADLVIGVGRSALEGMAAGRPVYVYDVVGGDGWVTPERYAGMEADGFAGLADRSITIDAARLTGDLGQWEQVMGEVNRDLIYSHHDAREHAFELVDVARKLDAPRSSARTVSDELARLVRQEWYAVAVATRALEEAAQMRTELDQSRQEAADLYAEHERLCNSLRYRLGSLLARPLDAARVRRRAERA